MALDIVAEGSCSNNESSHSIQELQGFLQGASEVTQQESYQPEQGSPIWMYFYLEQSGTRSGWFGLYFTFCEGTKIRDLYPGMLLFKCQVPIVSISVFPTGGLLHGSLLTSLISNFSVLQLQNACAADEWFLLLLEVDPRKSWMEIYWYLFRLRSNLQYKGIVSSLLIN